MRWPEGFIAVDWGTTNRRAYRLDAEGGVIDETEDRRGILAVEPGGFGAAIAEIAARLGERPMLLAGMIGSNRGWLEAPYMRCPAGLEELADGVVWAEPGRAAIVPGVACEEPADVMRGEEVQLLGAVADGLMEPDGLVCHPGTHNKWVRLENGRIDRFRTVMTGELFNLLREHSILSDLLQRPVEPDEAFRAGVRHGVERDDLTAELFSVRARSLLGEADGAASYTSGLLIGCDLKVGLAQAGEEEEIVIMGRLELTRLYRAALAHFGRSAREVDGERAFLAGVRALAERIR